MFQVCCFCFCANKKLSFNLTFATYDNAKYRRKFISHVPRALRHEWFAHPIKLRLAPASIWMVNQFYLRRGSLKLFNAPKTLLRFLRWTILLLMKRKSIVFLGSYHARALFQAFSMVFGSHVLRCLFQVLKKGEHKNIRCKGSSLLTSLLNGKQQFHFIHCKIFLIRLFVISSSKRKF